MVSSKNLNEVGRQVNHCSMGDERGRSTFLDPGEWNLQAF